MLRLIKINSLKRGLIKGVDDMGKVVLTSVVRNKIEILVDEGLTRTEIAAKLGLVYNTVNGYVTRYLNIRDELRHKTQFDTNIDLHSELLQKSMDIWRTLKVGMTIETTVKVTDKTRNKRTGKIIMKNDRIITIQYPNYKESTSFKEIYNGDTKIKIVGFVKNVG